MKFTNRIVIERPPREVYRYFIDPRNLRHWQANYERFRAGKGASKRPSGSRSTHVFKDVKGELEVEELVIKNVADREFMHRMSAKNMSSKVRYRFLDRGDSTELVAENELSLKPALLNFFAFFLKGSMREQQAADLRALKERLE